MESRKSKIIKKLKSIFHIRRKEEKAQRILFKKLLKENYWYKTQTEYLINSPYSTTSELCRSSFFNMPFFRYWMNKLKEECKYNRKLWEYAYVSQTLYEHGLLNNNSKGLVFGCGKEPLVSLYASMGCKITATDLSIVNKDAISWAKTNQHISNNNKNELNLKGICDKEIFNKNVEYMDVDMNNIPKTLQNYDFCWSICSLEHIGDSTHCLDFIKNSLKTLKSGGLAIHTTEFNLNKNSITEYKKPTVIFGKHDIINLIEELNSEGHYVYPLILDRDSTIVDKYIDNYPYFRTKVHLNLNVRNIPITSIGLIIKKK